MTKSKELMRLVKYWSGIVYPDNVSPEDLKNELKALPKFDSTNFLRDFFLGDRYEEAYSSIMSPLYEYIEKSIYMGDETTLILLDKDELDIEDIKNRKRIKVSYDV